MHTPDATGDTRRSFWLRVREFAVPPSMIESATARRHAGDWAGACAAARVDVDLDLRAVARAGGTELAARIRADLRHLAPDLLRWHMPRIAPDGLLRPGLTVSLARYDGPVHLVARTPPAWADAGQRISLAVWDGARCGVPHPHPHPDRRFRLDLHRHLWDARRTGELPARSGAPPGPWPAGPPGGLPPPGRADGTAALSVLGCAVDRWAAEAAIVLRTDGHPGGTVTVRVGARRRLVVDAGDGGITAAHGRGGRGPVLPDAATWVPPDVELLRAGLLDAGRLHPLVAAALVPDRPPPPAPPDDPGAPRTVECRGQRHRIGLAGGVLVAFDHDPAEIRREELLVALGGTPLPCLRAIDEAHRRPECLTDVRARLDHGDAAGALAVVERLLGPDALLRHGALREELETAAQRLVEHGLFRAGLAGGRGPAHRTSRATRSHPRHASPR
ncbi:hypothetical protein Daura_16265 [Dactylosporangium aurantiacum]|uniref:Uncharacterized protein n=1 Tax=Dactylosporangium aurantiacum TaxID=35754 RepID=A0A9Q9IMC2_9ACTN|nr:hypothetical protein [Dactylosporangium aurantiacum]MDG6103061.1 hypothetical protein [Dactylosporangium aurantiacum]UWZ57573.1 hypothetical protein Daura_16265 [Dactylosporangium aurantiacum]